MLNCKELFKTYLKKTLKTILFRIIEIYLMKLEDQQHHLNLKPHKFQNMFKILESI